METPPPISYEVFAIIDDASRKFSPTAGERERVWFVGYLARVLEQELDIARARGARDAQQAIAAQALVASPPLPAVAPEPALLFGCPACGNTFSASATHLGLHVLCPRCQHRLLPLSGKTRVKPEPAEPPKPRDWAAVWGGVSAIGGIVIGLLGVLAQAGVLQTVCLALAGAFAVAFARLLGRSE